MLPCQFLIVIMQKDEVHLYDLSRILFGEAPAEFLIEVFIRSLVIYIVALFIMRYLGKRMSGQLTITELAVMIMLGATIALPMQSADQGIAQGVLILLIILALQRGLNLLAFNKNSIERLMQGDVALLIKDGELNLKQMKKSRISRQEVFMVLRNKNLYHLGHVRRMYIEGQGHFSVYATDQAKPGLCVIPTDDASSVSMDLFQPPPNNEIACTNCGHVQAAWDNVYCGVCGNKEWTQAVIDQP